MLKQLRVNNQGVIFVTVIMIIIAMIVLTLSVISLNVSQSRITEREVKLIQSEMLARGALFKMVANQQTPSAGSEMDTLETFGNTTFRVYANIYGGGGGGAGGSSIPENMLILVEPL